MTERWPHIGKSVPGPSSSRSAIRSPRRARESNPRAACYSPALWPRRRDVRGPHMRRRDGRHGARKSPTWKWSDACSCPSNPDRSWLNCWRECLARPSIRLRRQRTKAAPGRRLLENDGERRGGCSCWEGCSANCGDSQLWRGAQLPWHVGDANGEQRPELPVSAVGIARFLDGQPAQVNLRQVGGAQPGLLRQQQVVVAILKGFTPRAARGLA